MRLQLLCVWIFAPMLFVRPAVSQTAEFQYPTGNETYNILDTLIVQWASNYANPTLFTWAWDAEAVEGDQVSKIENVPQIGNVSYSLEKYSNVVTSLPAFLWFDLVYDQSIARGFNGEGFHVTSDPAAVPTTWALGTSYVWPTPTSTSSTTPVSATTSIATLSSPMLSTSTPVTATPSSTGGSGMSRGEKAGIGIGIGALAIIGIIGIVLFSISHRTIHNHENHLRASQLHLEYKDETVADQKPPPAYQEAQFPDLGTELQEYSVSEIGSVR